jgi:hypothetical protein
LKNRTDNQCWRRFKILSKKPKTAAEKNKWENIGIYQAKINFKEPFKIERKKVKKDVKRNEGESPMKGNVKISESQEVQNNGKDFVKKEAIQEIQTYKDRVMDDDI